VLNLL